MLVSTIALSTSPAAAQAGTFTDPANDFLATYTGPHGADLDALSGTFKYDGSAFIFTGTLAGPVGTTPGALYVWGIDRGAGTARFSPALPNTDHILFDAIVSLNPSGTSSVRDLISGQVTNLGPNDVFFSGNTFFARVLAGLLPTQGFAPTAYTANLWPRDGSANAAISDFAPNNANITVLTTPEPSSAALLIPALGGIFGIAGRRRRG
jgi:hypothetical protein